jgi:hypothetical protein
MLRCQPGMLLGGAVDLEEVGSSGRNLGYLGHALEGHCRILAHASLFASQPP